MKFMNNQKSTEQMEKERAKRIVNEEVSKGETEEYAKEHEMKCPKCGGIYRNEAPNGAGIMEECNWHCLCGWEDGK